MRPRRREEDRRGNVVLRATIRAAVSTDTDQEAVSHLREVVAKDRREADSAWRILQGSDLRYDMDRARRLLGAALTGREVEPPPADRLDLFDQEERLGRMPLDQAFDLLAQRRPGLREIATRAAGARGTRRAKASGWSLQIGTHVIKAAPISNEAGTALSSFAGESDALAESGIARAIAKEYLMVLEGTLDRDTTTPHFNCRKLIVQTGTLYRPPAPADVEPTQG